MVRVVAIVVTYNGEPWIRKCISSIVGDHTVDLKVLLIDNCSQDNTVSIVKSEFPGISVVELDSNLGFGKANNIGLQYAMEDAYDFIFLLNQDAWIARGTIGDLVRLQQDRDEYGIISPIHLTGDGEKLDGLFGKYISPPSCPGLYSDALLGKLEKLYETKFVNAAAWLISRRCLNIVGGFDPIFPHYGEDSEYVLRGLNRGFKIGVTPTVFVCHDRPQTMSVKGVIDVYRQYIANIVDLKRADWSMRFAVVAVVKRIVDQFGTAALFGDFKSCVNLARVLFKTLLVLPKVLASRKKMAMDACPYLNSASSSLEPKGSKK